MSLFIGISLLKGCPHTQTKSHSSVYIADALNFNLIRKENHTVATKTDNITLQQTIKNLNNPDGYFTMTLTNAYYKIRIHYMLPDYQTHKQNNDFEYKDICIGVSPSDIQIPQFNCILSDNKAHAITIDTTCKTLTLYEHELDAYIENIRAAQETIKQLKEIIREYFGENMI